METVPAPTDTTTDGDPECICYDSNLPARADCPYCRPVEPAAPPLTAGTVEPGAIIRWRPDTSCGEEIVRVEHVSRAADPDRNMGRSVLLVFDDARIDWFGPTEVLTPVPPDEYQRHLADIEAHTIRVTTAAALRQIADLVDGDLPLPQYRLTVSACVNSVADLARAAELVGGAVQRGRPDHEIAVMNHDFGRYGRRSLVEFHLQATDPVADQPTGGAS
jgi:hypothetical protein